MKNLKTFEHFGMTHNRIKESQNTDSTDGVLPSEHLPKKLTIIKGVEGKTLIRVFSLGNVMTNANMTQIIYTADKPIFGHPDEMSIDIYYYRNHDIKLTVDIIYGDYMSCEFTLMPPNKINVIQYTSYRSEFDPSNTVFAFDNKTIQDFCFFLNQIKRGDVTTDESLSKLFNVTPDMLKFLDGADNYDPTSKN